MPAFQKQSKVQQTQEVGFLADLLDAPLPRARVEPIKKRPVEPPPQRKPSTEFNYDRITRVGATCVGLSLCVFGWIAGGYFTLAWLQSLGLTFARPGMIPIEYMLGHADGALPTLLPILIAWLAPIGVTLAEVGFWPKRASGRVSRVIWVSFVLLDSGTTSLGAYPIIATRMLSDSAWLVAIGVGLALALLPEKVGRALWRENF